jgi:hypothetical protein
MWGLSGYTFKGIYMELQKHVRSSEQSYITASRIIQGHSDWDVSSPAERLEIIENYKEAKEEHDKAELEMHHSHSHTERLHTLHNDLTSLSLHHPASSHSLEKSDNESLGHHEHHSLKHHLSLKHHSTSNISEVKSDNDSVTHNEHKHSLKHHLPHLHHSTPHLNELKSDNDSVTHHEHKHLLKDHLPHLHKHGNPATATFEGLVSESTEELSDELVKIPIVHEAVIRREMSI